MTDVFLFPGTSSGDLGFAGLCLSVRQPQLVRLLAQSKASQDTGRNNHMGALCQPKSTFKLEEVAIPISQCLEKWIV